MARQQLTTKTKQRALTAAEFQGLADVPPEVEWFANINNPRTREAYEHDLRDFMRFVGFVKLSRAYGEFSHFESIPTASWVTLSHFRLQNPENEVNIHHYFG